MPHFPKTGRDKMNLKFILLTLLSLFGYTFETEPARLGKKVEISFEDKLESFVNKHALFFIVISCLILSVLFCALIFALTGFSATESGLQYNHFMEVI